jgi:hypothetical protein
MTSVHGLGIGQNNEWYTPAIVFEALGETFDMDVAAPWDTTYCHVPTDHWICAHSLAAPWDGFIWMNAPFGGRNGLAPWLGKFFAHGNGIALTPDRASAPWFQDAWPKADAILLTRKIRFIRPDGTVGGSPANGTALWASGARAVAALHRARLKGFGVMAIPSAAFEPAPAQPHEVKALVGDTGEGKLSSRPSVAVCTSSTIATGEGTGGVELLRTARSHEPDAVTHRDLSQHADTGVSNTDEIFPVHASLDSRKGNHDHA